MNLHEYRGKEIFERYGLRVPRGKVVSAPEELDGVILVVHAGKSSRQVVRRARQLLQDVGAKIFGVVLNNVNLRSQDNYYYYQSYYHREGYRSSDEQ